MPRAQIRTGRAVQALEPDGDRWRVEVSDGTSIGADGVVLATPAAAAAGLLAPLPGAAEAATLLAAIGYASVAIAVLAFPLSHLGRPLDRSGFLVPRVEGTALTACSWSSTKWAHLAPDAADGTAVVRASTGRWGDDGALSLDDADLVSRLLTDLERTMAITGAPSEVRVNRWPTSFPQYAPGHLERVDAVERALPDGIALAGAALRGVGVPACIRSGREAAARVLVANAPTR